MASRRTRSTTKGREPRPPEPVTRDSLERAALAYAERFESSAANVRVVLERRVRRVAQRARWAAAAEGAAEASPPPPAADVAKWIDDAVDKVVRLGFVDDRRFAEGLVRRLRQRGTSQRAIAQKLHEKGVSAEIGRAQLEAEDAERGAGAELAAAVTYARRRRLGPYRAESDRPERRQRDLAALARAGFPFDVAQRVVDATAPEDLSPNPGPPFAP